jgi:hypothetical protein
MKRQRAKQRDSAVKPPQIKQKYNDGRHAFGKVALTANSTFGRNSSLNWNAEAFIGLLPVSWGSGVEVCII